jgi:cytidylate kinase
MNINGLAGGSPERVHGASSRVNQAHVSFDKSNVGATGELKASEHIQDQRVADLVSMLSNSPEIRPERIAEVTQKIQSNELLTRQAAEAVAEAFLRQY